ncbi:hypothetical protein THAOC_00414, partial [Thalassiosira oceanica]
YADYVFRSAALGLFGCDLSDSGPLPWRGASHGRAPSAPQAATDGGVIRRRRRRGAAAGEAASTDIRELTLYALADGTHSCDGSSSQPSVPVLRFAAAYGFKNVQSVLRGLSSPGTTAGGEGRRYDYVEVMACPSGCANGGGQVGPGGEGRETPPGGEGAGEGGGVGRSRGAPSRRRGVVRGRHWGAEPPTRRAFACDRDGDVWQEGEGTAPHQVSRGP